MLTEFDDFPVHQTSRPLAYLSTSERNAYGRYWFNGFHPDGDFYFGIAFAVYPNREVMDCALSILTKDGNQHSFRASRRMRGDRTDMRIGPFTLSIVEAMRTLHVTIDDNATGITADLTFRATTPAHEEPLDQYRQGVRTVMETTRFTQFGMWGGSITAGGRTLVIDPAVVHGTRDRSWGWRWTGEPEQGISRQNPEQVFWLWAPIAWRDRATHYGLFEYADGRRWKEFAHVFPRFDADAGFDPVSLDGFSDIGAAGHRLSFEPGSRFAGVSEIDLAHHDGAIETIRLTPLLRFPMLGIGYGHPDWGHGFYKGEEAIMSESWNVNDLDPLAMQHQHCQTVVRATSGDAIGHGVLEQSIIGPHHRYGFKEELDPA